MHSFRTVVEIGNERESPRRVNGGRVAPYLLALLLLLISWTDLAAGIEPQDVCTVTNNATKEYYNLQKLGSKDWKVEGKEGDVSYGFFLHVCGKVEHSSKVVDNEEMGVYLSDSSSSLVDKSLGKFNTSPYLQGGKLMLKYEGGHRCQGSEVVRHTSIIAFTCDSSVGEDNPPVFLGSSNDCGFFFEWSTPAACATFQPDSGGKSGWSVFFTILIIAIVVYIIGGVAYNRSVHNATGISQLPHAEFWANVWDYAKDISLILVYQLPCFKPAVHTRSYRNLPHDEEAELIDNFDEN